MQVRGRDDRYDNRSRSAHGDYLDDPRNERRSHRKIIKEEVVEPRRRSLSRNQKILAGVAGAALAVGGKELWDRRQHGGQAPENRNLIATAALAAGGAFAGYEGAEIIDKQVGKRTVKKKDNYLETSGRHGNPAEYLSSDSEGEKKKSRRKSILEGALGLAGLGAAAKASERDRSRDGRRSRGGSDSGESRTSRRRGKSRGGDDRSEGMAKIQQAAKAALLAGATEAFRVRNEPGGWSGAKGKRVLTAAIGAGGIDAAADRDPEHHSKRHILEAVIGGLAGNRLIHGSRSELETGGDGRGGGRSRSRSRGPGGGAATGLAALATAGLGALAAKKLTSRSRSRNRDEDDDDRSARRRSYSDGEDRPRRKRSKSVTDFARKGLAALGIGEAAEDARDDRRRDRLGDREIIEETRETRKYKKNRDRAPSDESSDDEYDNRRRDRRDKNRDRDGGGNRDRGGGGERDRDQDRNGGGNDQNRGEQKEGREAKRVAEGKQATSDSDSLGSSTGDEKRVKKMKGKQILTAGLATVATIHAAHNVYQSYEKREARKKAVESGQMSKEEEKKLKMKALLQDTASVGIAALGIKGAVSVWSNLHKCLLPWLTSSKEWKEMREMRHEYKEFAEKKEERHKKRVQLQRGQHPNGDQRNGDHSDRRLTHQSMPDLYQGGRYEQQPYYTDGNPYASGGLPAPPVGYAYDDRYDDRRR
jgi:hypothetical protein